MGIEISIRENERRQLTEFLPQVIDQYEAMRVDDDGMVSEKIETFEMMLSTFEEQIDGYRTTYEFDEDEWRDLSTGLVELDGTRSAWLRAKISRRAELSVVQMGFTSTIPVMAQWTGSDPVKPDS